MAKQGVADFHAAGRHTYVTELLRNGTMLPEARELARHSDVRLTMRYTHIGLDDQAKALSGLPLPKRAGQVSCASWQRIGSGRRVPPCQPKSSGDTKPVTQDGNHINITPAEARVMAPTFVPRHLLARKLMSGGGGNRTRVP